MDLRETEHLYCATDLTNFIGCRHLSALEQLAAHRLVRRPFFDDPMLEILRERGLAQRHVRKSVAEVILERPVWPLRVGHAPSS